MTEVVRAELHLMTLCGAHGGLPSRQHCSSGCRFARIDPRSHSQISPTESRSNRSSMDDPVRAPVDATRTCSKARVPRSRRGRAENHESAVRCEGERRSSPKPLLAPVITATEPSIEGMSLRCPTAHRHPTMVPSRAAARVKGRSRASRGSAADPASRDRSPG